MCSSALLSCLLCVCFVDQEKKVDAKKKMLMLKAFKFLKTCRSNESDLISIPEAVCMVKQMSSALFVWKKHS